MSTWAPQGGQRLLTGATLVDGTGIVADGWLLVDERRILARGIGTPPEHVSAPQEHLPGRHIRPAAIDIHLHGGGGAAHEDGAAAIATAANAHRAAGTGRSVISFVAAPLDDLVRSLAEARTAMRSDPRLLGVHLEGPFLGHVRRGVHDAAALRDPTPAAVDALLDAADGVLAQVTIDPALPGALDAVQRFVAAGVRVAVGHTDADHATAAAAFDAGATLLTHAFNAMRGIEARAPGPVVAAIQRDHVRLELVLDGHHVHPASAALLFRSAPGRVVLVTDAMAAAAAGDGDYRLGTQAVRVRGGRAVLDDRPAVLAGSVLTLAEAIRTGLAFGQPHQALVHAATVAPAEALGLVPPLLEPGGVADLVITDPAGRVERVLLAR